MLQGRARREMAPADIVIVAALSYPPAVSAVDEWLGLSTNAFPVLLLIGAGLIALAAAVTIDRREPIKHRGAVVFFLALFLMVTVASNLRAYLTGIRWDGVAMWRQMVLAMTPALLFWAARDWSARRFSSFPIDLGAKVVLALCTSSIFLEITGYATYEVYGSRYFGFLGDQVAWLLSFLAVYFLTRGNAALLGLSALLLIITQSRGPLLITALGIGLSVLLSRRVDTRTQLLRLVSLLAGVLIIILAQEFFDSFLSRLSNTNLLENDRTRTIAFTLDVFRLRPVLGSGYNAHTYYFMPRIAVVNYTYEQWATPVSTWAQVLADSGALGFLPFTAWMLLCCKAAWRALRLKSDDTEVKVLCGLAAWVMPFLLFNHTAAWLLPASMLSPLVFTVAGLVVGRIGVLSQESEEAFYRASMASQPRAYVALRQDDTRAT